MQSRFRNKPNKIYVKMNVQILLWKFIDDIHRSHLYCKECITLETNRKYYSSLWQYNTDHRCGNTSKSQRNL